MLGDIECKTIFRRTQRTRQCTGGPRDQHNIQGETENKTTYIGTQRTRQ